jgi:heme-degrading monooxygenase HmoA
MEEPRMFARVSVYNIPAARMDDALEEFRSALAQISEWEGFREAFFFLAPDDDRATATTLWTSRRALEASRASASNLRTNAAHAVEGSVVSAIEYEVGLHLGETQGSA